MHSNFIVLVSKKGQLIKETNISLLTSAYKIVTNVLVNWLGEAFSYIVSQSQFFLVHLNRSPKFRAFPVANFIWKAKVSFKVGLLCGYWR